jgi:hypothetical protein
MIAAWRAVAIGHPRTDHGAFEAEETMSRIRTVLRSAIVLGVVAAGVSALDLLLATPAAARCFGYGCGYRYHARPAYPAYFRRAAMPRWSMAPWQRRHGNPMASTSSSHGCKHCYQRNPNAATVSPHGPGGGAGPTGASFSPYGSGGGGGGYGSGGGGRYGSDGGGGGYASGGGGGGSGQYTTSGSSGGNRPSQSGPAGTGASTTGVPGGSAATKHGSNPVLTAVAACVTPKGSCPMQRDLGTACQCKDPQGNFYDGIMK